MGRKIYLVRHGKPNTEGGKKRCIGVTDLHLSDLGKKQAEKMGIWLAGQNIKKIYSSPLSRCLETAGVIRDVMKEAGVTTSAIWVRENLHEMSVGLWENMTFGDIKAQYPKEYEARGENLGYFAPPGGESFAEAGERFEECLDEIRNESKDDILVVAHAGVIRGYLCRLLGLSANEVQIFPQPYGGVTILEEKDKKLSIVEVGWKPYTLLEQEDLNELYKECGTPENVVRHMVGVADFLDEIHASLSAERRDRYNWEVLRKAALLHDVRRTDKNHAKTSADFLVKEGYPELGELVRYHHDSGMQDGELTAEEILFYADKRVQEDKVVSVEERFAASKKKCLTEKALEKHSRMYAKTKQIEDKIYQCS